MSFAPFGGYGWLCIFAIVVLVVLVVLGIEYRKELDGLARKVHDYMKSCAELDAMKEDGAKEDATNERSEELKKKKKTVSRWWKLLVIVASVGIVLLFVLVFDGVTMSQKNQAWFPDAIFANNNFADVARFVLFIAGVFVVASIFKAVFEKRFLENFGGSKIAELTTYLRTQQGEATEKESVDTYKAELEGKKKALVDIGGVIAGEEGLDEEKLEKIFKIVKGSSKELV